MNRIPTYQKTSHPFPSSVRKVLVLLAFLAGWLLFVSEVSAQCPNFTVDLSSSPTATYVNPDFFSPSGQCCGAGPGNNCFSYEITLHGSSNAVIINLERQGGVWGQIEYYVDCLNYGLIYENQPLIICLDGPGPHTITFCRSSSISATFRASIAQSSYNPTVSLEPFDDACTADPLIYLTGGSPSGGKYYVNGAEAFFVNPTTAGAGTYEVTYVYSGPNATCASVATQTFEIFQTPTPSLSLQEFCAESGLVPMAGGSPGGGEYLGTYINSNMFDTNLSGPGNFNITYQYISPEGCPAQASGQVQIAPLPPANAGPDQIIPGGTTAVIEAVGADIALYDYSWSPAGQVVNPLLPITNTVALTNSELFTLTVGNPLSGCQNHDQTAVYVSGGPLDIVLISASSDDICQQDSVFLFVLPTGGSGSYLYEWYDFNTPPGTLISTEEGFWHKPDVNTTYRVEVRDLAFPAGPFVEQTITVDVTPLPVVTLQPFDPVCGNETYYPLTGASPAGGYFSLPVQGIHNITSVNPMELGQGYHTISYTVVHGHCRSIQSQYLQVYPRAEAKFYAQQDFCATHEVTFLNLSNNTDHFVWQIGTEPALVNPPDPLNHTFAIPPVTQMVPVTLTATNLTTGCTDTRTRMVEVIPPTIAGLNVDQDLAGCAPYDVKFTNQTTGPVAFFLWDFGDGSISTQLDPLHTFHNHTDANITYTVVLTAISGNFMCVSRDTIEITVRPFLQAGFGLMPVSSCSPYDAEIFNNALGFNITQTWDFGDGTVYNSSDPVLFHTYENNTPDPIDFTITQTVTNPQGCVEVMETDIVIYPYQESGFTASTLEGCAPLTVNFTDNSTGAAYQFFWDFDDGGTSDLKNPVHTFENQTDASITYRVLQVTDNNNFCPDTSWVDILVHPEVKAGFNFFPAEVCAPHQANVVNTSTGNINSYSWFLIENGITTPAGNTDVFDHLFQNAGPDPIDYTVVLEVGNSQGCINRKELPLRVNPEVIAQFEPTDTIGCQPLQIGFTNQSVNGHVFLWEFGDGGSSNLFNPDHTYQNNNYLTPQTYNVSLFVESTYLCSDTYELEIELLPAIEALFTVDTAKGCSPFEVQIEHFSKGANIFEWDFGDGNGSADGSPDLTHTYINNTDLPLDYTLRLVVENAFGCTDTLERIITVYPEVTSQFASVSEGCHPLTVSFSNLSENAHYFSWQFGSDGQSLIANPNYTFTNTSHTLNQDYQVILEASSIYGCKHVSEETITVYPKPNPGFTLASLQGCSPFDLDINNESEGATSHFWSFGDGSTSTDDDLTLTHTYLLSPGNTMQTMNLQLLVTNDYGCADSLLQQVTIFPQIIADFDISIDSGCHPLTVEFTNQSEGASAYAAYFWTYGDGFESATGANQHSHTFLNHSYTDEITYTIQLLAMNLNACSDVREMEVTVLPAPFTSFSVSEPVGCSPHQIELENLTQGGTQFTWTFGDGGPALITTDTLINYQYQNAAGNMPAEYILNLEASNDLGCSRSHQQMVIIYPEVEAVFTSETEGCHPLIIHFENESVGASNSIWSFGEGNHSQQNSPSHLFLNHSNTQSASFEIILYSENEWGCHDSTIDTITVRPVPMSNFNLLTRSGCSPFTTDIFNLSVGATSFSWDLANATSVSNENSFSHTWHNTTGQLLYYQLELSVENEFGCVDHSLQSITVFPEVEAEITTSDGVLAGCSPFGVQFLNLSQLTQTYVWDFGNGNITSGANPWHSFTNEGPDNAVFNIEMIGTSMFGCTDTTWLDITVFPTPVAKFDATPKLQTYPSRTIDLENLSKPGTWNYSWSFGDGHTHSTTLPDTFDYTYDEWDINDMSTRSFTITLGVENQGCADNYSQQITITSPVPQAQFSPSAQGCAPFEVQFYNVSQHAHSYFWSFGDGAFSLNENPKHLFVNPGLYEVELIAYGDGGSDTTYQYITVFENPVADFSLVKPIITIPYEPLQLINNSQGADIYHWDFGDGNTSTEFEPEHWYQFANTYTITLAVATNTEPSCRDTLRLTNGLLVQDACNIAFPNAFTPQESGPHGGACDPYNLEQTTFEVFYPKMEGMERYELEIFNRWGEIIFRSTDPYKGWDGYYRGKLMTMDVYVWKFSGICVNGQAINLVGDVTLIR